MTNISEFTNLYQEENEKLFEQGIWLAEHCVDKKAEAEIKLACGLECGASADTINKRLRVGRVFGDNYFVDCNWTLHVKACELAHVDHKKPETVAKAHELMDVAIKGYPDPKTGVIRPHSAATLEAAIKPAAQPAGGKQKAEVVFTGEATCYPIDSWHYSFDFSSAVSGELQMGERVTLTITRAPQPALAEAVADESEVRVA